MRLQGSSASSASVASRLYGTRSRRDSLGGSSSESDLIAFGGDQDALNDFSSQVSYQVKCKTFKNYFEYIGNVQK